MPTTNIDYKSPIYLQLREVVRNKIDEGEYAPGCAIPSENELAEMAVIEEYLPKKLSADELEAELQKIIAEVGATSPQEMGKVMGVATKKLAGRADGKDISVAVRRLLAK